MKIPIAKLSAGVSESEFEEPAATSFPDSADGFSAAISGHLKIDKQESHIYINGFVSSRVKLSCDRCLRDFEQNISGDFKLYFAARPQNGQDDGVRDDPDLRVLTPADQDIDLSEDIRDVLLLSVPMKNLCREDCRGLCSGCGIDLNESACNCHGRPIDSRWEALQQLRDRAPGDKQDKM